MEVAHREGGVGKANTALQSFNPCSNGSCSPRSNNYCRALDFKSVLILVLMEVAHRDRRAVSVSAHEPGFNPCSNGSCSPSFKAV